MRARGTVFAVAVACMLVGTVVVAGPKPKPGSGAWQLDCSFLDPQRITIKLPGDAGEMTYWYMLYTVTNRTGMDVQFFPSFSLVTDRLEVVTAGDDVHPLVYDTIAARHKKQYPFFAPPSKITGPLLQGEDNHRTSAAVFKEFDKEADAFTVFGGGLSGEIVRVINPAFDESTPESDDNVRWFVLRKTLAIIYDLPGDAESRDQAVPIRRNREWVMR